MHCKCATRVDEESVSRSESTRGVHQTSSHCSTVCVSAETEVCLAEARLTPGRILRVLITTVVDKKIPVILILPEESDIPEAPEACEESAWGAGGAEGVAEEEEEEGG